MGCWGCEEITWIVTASFVHFILPTCGPAHWAPWRQFWLTSYPVLKGSVEFSCGGEFYRAWNFPTAEKCTSRFHARRTQVWKCAAPQSNPPNFWTHLRMQWRTYHFHSPEEEVSKSADESYKQAARLAVGQLASKTGHGSPGTEENAEHSQHRENAQLGSQNQHTVGKSTGLSCWPVMSAQPTNEPLKLILEKQVFIRWFYLAYGFRESGAEPWKQTGLYQTGKCLFPGTYRRASAMQKDTGDIIHPNFIRIYYSRIVSYGLGDTSRFFIFISTRKVLLMLGNLISEELSIISYQLLSISTCSTKSNSN